MPSSASVRLPPGTSPSDAAARRAATTSVGVVVPSRCALGISKEKRSMVTLWEDGSLLRGMCCVYQEHADRLVILLRIAAYANTACDLAFAAVYSFAPARVAASYAAADTRADEWSLATAVAMAAAAAALRAAPLIDGSCRRRARAARAPVRAGSPPREHANSAAAIAAVALSVHIGPETGRRTLHGPRQGAHARCRRREGGHGLVTLPFRPRELPQQAKSHPFKATGEGSY